MQKNKKALDEKIERYFNDLFAGVGQSQQLFDLKEELSTNLKEKIADYQSRGLDGEQAFKEAVISMGDLSGLVEDMRQLGQDTAKQSVYSSMANRISIAGTIAGVLLILFGGFTIFMLYFMGLSAVNVVGPGIFIVAGGALLTYSLLTRETHKKYGMNKIRAALYAVSTGVILFALFSGFITYFATVELYAGISASMVFSLVGVGLFLVLILTGTDRRKKRSNRG
ncbi:permease prefix domain 1-containing protein [Kroppenstedtia eburnea]|uniref:permease prefix domain 1-containing protein n=1 Tax=Kroppenstedtia eburnea TaxID=714067 RepID=UPI00363D7603